VTVTPTNVVQMNEYYPFGYLAQNSWTRDNTTANNFLANGGTELNATTQLYDLDFRNYDPVLGRLHQVDPLADKYHSFSSFHFSFNNPVGFTDPSGATPVEVEGNTIIINWDEFGTHGGSYSNSWGYVGYESELMAFYAGTDYMDKYMAWGGSAESARSFEGAAQKYASMTGQAIPLRTVSITAAREASPWLSSRIDLAYENIGHSYDYWKSMTNPLVQRIHRGQNAFANDPMGGTLLAFLGGAGAGGLGNVIRGLSTLGKAAYPIITNSVTTVANTAIRNFARNGIRNLTINLSAQLTSKYFSNEDIGNIDIADALVASVSGDSYVLNAIGSSLLNLDLYGNGSTGFSDPAKGIVDLSTGMIFGAASTGVTSYLGTKNIISEVTGVVDYTINLWNNAASSTVYPSTPKK
jgi:RHS repeat-associated protein